MHTFFPLPDASPAPASGFSIRGVVAQRRLAAEECERVVRAARAFAAAPPEVVGNSRLTHFRLGEVRKFLPTTDDARWTYEQLLAIAAAENEQHFLLALEGVVRPAEYVEYTPGNGHFHWHDDYSHEAEESPRKLTVILQLSDSSDYEGGDFQAWNVPIETLSRERGSVLLLPSFLPHCVTPVTRGVRRILVMWVGGPRIR